MKFSTKGRYALRLMIDLAQHDTGEFISLKDISKRQEISVKYLEQIVIVLAKAGYLRSVRGPQGGYRLVKQPQEYCVGDILRLTEGSLAPVACMTEEPNECGRYGVCPTISFWQGLAGVIDKYVNSFTLQDLVQNAHDNYMI